MYLANSLAELNSHVDVGNLIKGKNVKYVANSASILFNKAKEFYDSNNYENAYINFMKFFQCVKYIQTCDEYKKDKKFYNVLLGKKQVEAVENAENLSKILEKAYRLISEKKIDNTKNENNRENNVTANVNNILSFGKTSLNPNDGLTNPKHQTQISGCYTPDNSCIPQEKKSNKELEHLKYMPLENFIKLLKTSIKNSLPMQKHDPNFIRKMKIDKPFVLIVDIRSSEDYKKAHIDYPFLINIPKDIINKKLSNQIMQEWFEMSTFPDNDIPFASFNCYKDYDYIVIIDYHGQKTHLDNVYAETVAHNLFEANIQNVYVLSGGFLNLQRQYSTMIITSNKCMDKPLIHMGVANTYNNQIFQSPELVNNEDHYDNNSSLYKQNHLNKLSQNPIKYPDLTAIDQHNNYNMEMNGEISEDEDILLPRPTKSFLYPEENLRQTVSQYEVAFKRREESKNTDRENSTTIWENPKSKTDLSGDSITTKIPRSIGQTTTSVNKQSFNVPGFNNIGLSDRDVRNPAFLTKYGSSKTCQGDLIAKKLPQAPIENSYPASFYPARLSGPQNQPDKISVPNFSGVPPYQQPNILPYPVNNYGPGRPVFNGHSYNQQPVRAIAPAIVGTLHRVRSNPDLPKIHALVSDSLAATDDDFSTGLRRLNLAKNWGRPPNPSPARREVASMGPPVSNYRYREESRGRQQPVPNVDRTLKPSSASSSTLISCSSSTSSASTLQTTKGYEDDEGSVTSPGLLYDYSDHLNATQPESSYISNESQDSYTTTDRSISPNSREEIIFRQDAKALSTVPPSSVSRYRGSNELPSGSHGLTGILNTGNSCFINSTLQSLSHTVPLAEYFVNRRFIDHLNRRRKGFAPNRCLAAQFSNVCGGLWSGKHQSINPISFTEAVVKYIPGMEMGVQQDCHEFLTFLLDGLHEDLNRASNSSSNQASSSRSDEENSDSQSQLSDYELAFKAEQDYSRNNDSIIVDLMSGQLKSVVQCERCFHKSITFDTFQGLSLPLPSSGKCTLQDCLRLFLSPEPISDWKCAKCKKRAQASKELFLWKIPPILIIHLMRFKTEGSSHKKITTVVDFPINGFDLTNYCAEVRQNERLPEYTLYAISNHYGTLEGGHYTAFCKNPINQRWYKYDDQQVMEISSADIRTPAAYLLFYTSLGIKTPDFL